LGIPSDFILTGYAVLLGNRLEAGGKDVAELAVAQIGQFREFGFTVVENLFDARETAALQAEVTRFHSQGLLRNVRTRGDGATPSASETNLQLIPLYDKSDLLRALPFETKVTDVVTRLIGDSFILHLDQLFLKPARSGAGTSWHQDNAYFKIADPLMGVAMWIAIHDATIDNGTLHLIPGSHREVFEHGRDPYSNHHIHCPVPEERAQAVELRAGGAVFFCYGMAHSTRDNRTDGDRAGIAFHFLNSDFAAADLLKPDRTSHPYLTGPSASGGEREYGVTVSGTWRSEVDRVLAT
jgi:phytanoyl-CoA hydroxylase